MKKDNPIIMTDTQDFVRIVAHKNSDSDTEYESGGEDTKMPINWKGSIYDDDEFEQNTIWRAETSYVADRRIKSRFVNLNEAVEPKVVEPKVVVEKKKDEVVLSFPKGPAWQVKKIVVETFSDTNPFPSLGSIKESIKESIKVSTKKQHEEEAVVPRRLLHEPRYTERPKNPERSQEKVVYKNTRMCNFGVNCKKRGVCSFAHTLEEFHPVECRFQASCKNRSTCTFKHGNESKEEFLARTAK